MLNGGFTARPGSGLTPFDINAVRFGSAGLTLALCTLLAKLWSPSPRSLGAAGAEQRSGGGGAGAMGGWAYGKVGAGILFCTCLCPTLNNVALFRLPLATAVTLGSTGPLFALPITWLVGAPYPRYSYSI